VKSSALDLCEVYVADEPPKALREVDREVYHNKQLEHLKREGVDDSELGLRLPNLGLEDLRVDEEG